MQVKRERATVTANLFLPPSHLQDKNPPRRWSSIQVKEFGPLHGTLSLLVRNTDISMFESETDPAEEPQTNPYMIPSNAEDLQRPSDGMHQALFTIECSKRFIREVRQGFSESVTCPSCDCHMIPTVCADHERERCSSDRGHCQHLLLLLLEQPVLLSLHH